MTTSEDNIRSICYNFVEQVQSAFSRQFELNKPSGQESSVDDRTGFIFWNAVSQSGVFEGNAVIEFYSKSLMEISKKQFYEMAIAETRVYGMNKYIERSKEITTAKVMIQKTTIASQVEQAANSALWKATVVFSVDCEFAIL